MSEGHYASADIQARLRGLEEERARLHETWVKRGELFRQSYDLQLFLRDAEQRDGWMGSQEVFLSNEELGVGHMSSHMTGGHSQCAIGLPGQC